MDTLRLWLVAIMTICVSAGLIWNAYTFIETSQRLDEAKADAVKWRNLAHGTALTGGPKVLRVTALPDTPLTGEIVLVMNDGAAGACNPAERKGLSTTLCRYDGEMWVALGMDYYIDATQRLAEAEVDAALWRKIELGEYPVDILNCKVATHGPCYDENMNKVRDARR